MLADNRRGYNHLLTEFDLPQELELVWQCGLSDARLGEVLAERRPTGIIGSFETLCGTRGESESQYAHCRAHNFQNAGS